MYYFLKENFPLQITESGQLNQTKVAERIDAAEDEGERAKVQKLFEQLDEDLKAEANDVCSAGKICQKYAFIEEEATEEALDTKADEKKSPFS